MIAANAAKTYDVQADVFGNRIAPDLIGPAQAVDLELAPDEGHFHNARMLHISGPNTSLHRRYGDALRCVPARVARHIHAWSRDHKIYPLRGEDCTGGCSRDTLVAAH